MNLKKGSARRWSIRKRFPRTEGNFAGRRYRRRISKENLVQAGRLVYQDRRSRRRDSRRLWIIRISAAARMHGLRYSQFISGLRIANIELDRKVLSDMAIHDAAGFGVVVAAVKRALGAVKKVAEVVQPVFWIEELEHQSFLKLGKTYTLSIYTSTHSSSKNIDNTIAGVNANLVPSMGLRSRWVLTATDARFAKTNCEVTLTKRHDWNDSVTFELLIPKAGESPRQQIEVTPTSLNAIVSVMIFGLYKLGDDTYPELLYEFDVLLPTEE